MSNHDREGSRSSNRDADLARAWREASDEQPPAHLDAAITAAARKSVPDHGEQRNNTPDRVHSRNWLMRWQPLAAAATVAGLAFALVQMLPREHDFVPSMQRNEPAPIPASAAPPRAPSAETAEATVSEAAATADTAMAPGETSADRRDAMEPAMAGRTDAAAVPSSAAREKNLGKAAPLDAAAWAAEIAALHASGDLTAAEHALRAFRSADPDADTYLPDSLRDWARSVQ